MVISSFSELDRRQFQGFLISHYLTKRGKNNKQNEGEHTLPWPWTFLGNLPVLQIWQHLGKFHLSAVPIAFLFMGWSIHLVPPYHSHPSSYHHGYCCSILSGLDVWTIVENVQCIYSYYKVLTSLLFTYLVLRLVIRSCFSLPGVCRWWSRRNWPCGWWIAWRDSCHEGTCYCF